MENAGIVHFQNEQGGIACFVLGHDVELRRHFKLVVRGAFLGIQADLNADIRLYVAGDPLLGHDIFKRHIANELAQNLHFHRGGLRCLGFAVFGHVNLLN